MLETRVDKESAILFIAGQQAAEVTHYLQEFPDVDEVYFNPNVNYVRMYTTKKNLAYFATRPYVEAVTEVF